MSAYYNENNAFAAAWLRELIKAGLIADGEVDERSIELVQPDDLRGFVQCHFFAGIGGWSYALRLAGWPDDRAVWTGSCPCQPFSVAGQVWTQGGGAADPRHLWPAWFRLIAERRPAVIFGEQVASADALGWFDRVSTELEDSGYAIGAADLCAAGIGADHIRQRLWFVADASGVGCERHGQGEEIRRAANDDTRSEVTRAFAAETGIIGPAYTQRRQWSLDRADGRVGREDTITWHGHWATAPEPFVCRGTHGIPSRLAQLRGYGNAIVPQVAQVFIEAYMSLAVRP